MVDWIVNKLLKQYLKGFLDKLPLNNYKTLLSVITYIIIEVLKVIDSSGMAHEILSVVLNAISPYAADIQLSAVIGAIVGLIHKLLKKAFD